jgi:MFS family permease
MTAPRRARPAGGRRWPRRLLLGLCLLVAVVVVVVVACGIWTDYLWFASVRYRSVFATRYGVKWALFAITAVVTGLAVAANAALAYRLRPVHRPPSPEQAGLDGYRIGLDRRSRLLLVTGSVVIGVITGLTATLGGRPGCCSSTGPPSTPPIPRTRSRPTRPPPSSCPSSAGRAAPGLTRPFSRRRRR